MNIDTISNTILDESSSPEALREALDAYVRECSDVTNVRADATFDAWAEDSLLENGVAINPQGTHNVVYNNEIHDVGDWQTLNENDFNGVSIPPNSSDLWIVDNHIYHMGSDGVGSGHAANQPRV